MFLRDGRKQRTAKEREVVVEGVLDWSIRKGFSEMDVWRQYISREFFLVGLKARENVSSGTGITHRRFAKCAGNEFSGGDGYETRRKDEDPHEQYSVYFQGVGSSEGRNEL